MVKCTISLTMCHFESMQWQMQVVPRYETAAEFG